MPSPVQEQATENSIPFCPLTPTEHQRKFADSTAPGAAYLSGHQGGKTAALLMAAFRDMDKFGQRALILAEHVQWSWEMALDWVRDIPDVKVSPWERLIKFPNGGVLMFADAYPDPTPRLRACDFSFIGVDTNDYLSEGVTPFLLTRLRIPPRQLKEVHHMNTDDGRTEVWETQDR